MMNCSILWCADVNSAFIANKDSRSGSNIWEQNGHEKSSILQRKQAIWKKDLFAIHFPFVMKSQLERMQREKEMEKTQATSSFMSSAQRKRKRKENKPRSVTSDEEQNVVCIRSALKAIVEKASDLGLLLKDDRALHLSDNNKSATTAASAPGCGSLFYKEFQGKEGSDFTHCSSLRLDKEKPLKISVSDIIGRQVIQALDTSSILQVDGHIFLIPARSSFLTSSFHHFVSLGYLYFSVKPGYDLVVIDPPWRNKSVKRKKSYHTLTENDLIKIPLDKLCSDGALVCVWVTNNLKLIDFVKDILFPAWSVCYLATWMWVKVTTSGKPVCELLSEHKKPYEWIVIGRFEIKECKDLSTETTDKHQENISTCNTNLPDKFMLVSVPCALHSKKPVLIDVLQPFLPANPHCLELFARNLMPGWTSWGDEPLCHQHVDFMEPSSLPD